MRHINQIVYMIFSLVNSNIMKQRQYSYAYVKNIRLTSRIFLLFLTAGFEQAVKGLAKPAERREIPPPMHDGHLIHKLQSNYWVAEAEDAWAATTLYR